MSSLCISTFPTLLKKQKLKMSSFCEKVLKSVNHTGEMNFDLKKLNGRRAVFWIFTISLVCGGFAYHVWSLVSKYLLYEYDEKILSVASRGVQFPDVTVCNMDALFSRR